MIREARLLLAVGGLALSACSSGGDSLFERIAPVVREQVFGDDAPPAETPQITRADLDAIPFAMIALSAEGAPPGFLVPLANNGGYLVYQDPARRGVTMRGGLVTGTDGLGYNLKSVKHQLDDPIARPRPLSAWPGDLKRSYRFSLSSRDDYEIAVACTLDRGVQERIEIVEITFDLVRITESCSNPRRRFVNTYWADPGTGFVWKSEQWVGPQLPPMTIEIVRPYLAG